MQCCSPCVCNLLLEHLFIQHPASCWQASGAGTEGLCIHRTLTDKPSLMSFFPVFFLLHFAGREGGPRKLRETWGASESAALSPTLVVCLFRTLYVKHLLSCHDYQGFSLNPVGDSPPPPTTPRNVTVMVFLVDKVVTFSDSVALEVAHIL